MNGHIIGFRPHTEKLESPYKTLSNTFLVKGLKKHATGSAVKEKGKNGVKYSKKKKVGFTLLYAFSSHGILAPAHFHESLVSGKPHGYIWFHIHECSNDFLAIALSV